MTTYIDLSERDFNPPRNQRVSRCRSCDLAFTWKGSAPRPGCPTCGGRLSTTTRQLKAGFVTLEGAALAHAERQPGGLPAEISFHEKRAQDAEERARKARESVGRDDVEVDEDGTIWDLRPAYDWEVERGQAEPGDMRRSSGIQPRYLDESAARHREKVAKYQRRVEKLGGAFDVEESAKAQAAARGLAPVAGGSHEADQRAAIEREVKRRGAKADRLGGYVLAYVKRGELEKARELLKAYRDDADLDDAEATSRAQDFTDDGGWVDKDGDPIEARK